MEFLKNLKAKPNKFDLSRIGLGGMRMGNNTEDAIKVIHSALDAGVNFLNTADFYDHGQNELLLREALKSRKREEVFISVKFGGMISPDGRFYGIDSRPESVKNYLTYTLRRLGTDYLDLYQPARINPNIPVEETIGAVAEMVKAGYVKSIGISEVDGDTLRRANSVHPISLVEVRYSLMDRHIEDDLLPVARELGVGVVAFGVLLAGIIGGSTPDNKLAMMSNRLPKSIMNNLSTSLSYTDALQEIANEKEVSLAQLAIAWVLAQGEDILALVGSRTINQIKDTVTALGVHLSKNDLERIEKIIPKDQASCSYMLDIKNINKNGLFQL